MIQSKSDWFLLGVLAGVWLMVLFEFIFTTNH